MTDTVISYKHALQRQIEACKDMNIQLSLREGSTHNNRKYSEQEIMTAYFRYMKGGTKREAANCFGANMSSGLVQRIVERDHAVVKNTVSAWKHREYEVEREQLLRRKQQ